MCFLSFGWEFGQYTALVEIGKNAQPCKIVKNLTPLRAISVQPAISFIINKPNCQGLAR
jgi:hypothetical protein